MTNYILTIREVRKLSEGARVWVEHRKEYAKQYDGPHVHTHNRTERLLTGCGENQQHAWDLRRNPEYFGTVYRVWALDVPPTEEEKAENEWKGEDR